MRFPLPPLPKHEHKVSSSSLHKDRATSRFPTVRENALANRSADAGKKKHRKLGTKLGTKLGVNSEAISSTSRAGCCGLAW